MSNDTTARSSRDNPRESKTLVHNAADVEAPAVDKDTDVEAGSQATKTTEEPHDPNVVDWDGPDDPENPMNWPQHKKVLNIVLISLFTFLT